MRRGPGLAALDRSAATSLQYNSLSSELTSSQLTELHAQLDTFSSALRNFAARHRGDIKRDASFRHAFQQMCAAIGVDPLGGRAGPGGLGNLGRMWNDVLGLGDWQYELGIQIIDVCVSTRPYNGGLIRMDDLIRAVMHSRGKKEGEEGDITEEDVVRSIAVLKPLGSGYEVIDIAGTKMVRSVPKELDTDTSVVLGLLSSSSSSTAAFNDAVGNRYVTEDGLLDPCPELAKGKWTRQRARAILDDLSLGQGILWIDEQAHPARYYSLLGLGAGLTA
ncbi:winged helix DNA-binding domain-containing protein [Acaromyces ingoldii]|uniref:Winged helix DNA-binding domain-containing protein n=1 Tax=Acaromyces ingoldii TaxID=215250 RepID=A0A316YWQ7_9BASI|nr:winged helix DNA-binding domain-containing protein [Acaromyces ingoldii]PWN93857.1 winged helix DNA-binding domain-containing protein [Acaromyces ingoldii]